MTDMYDYESLLHRVREALPEDVTSRDRFEVPKVDVIYEGKNTIIRNFMDIVKKIDRDPMHVYKYLMRELGTAGNIQGDRLVLKGRVSHSLIQNRIDSYIKTYVICYECGSPDTELRKEGRVEILVCKACGAIRPVHGKVAVRMATAKLEEGKIYDLEITDLSRDGDGIARYGEYTIYVPGARKGEKVKVKIEKIKKDVAFGRIAS
ncbi:translation initiation factor aIF-2, beta subunit, putative [Aciduliprofundum sp. MAR08-339]|uniref:translation initiation factor IF-2 subunit beta n=1 Tax=Aciduliprofundum sp. (strain MAR08-339) TaxID=673860 RepID=UPI0002A4C7A4|nr:translation initiation factor aIF-2, beta subunit, putative [Aciduliprofundum sp. MAR08-339]